MILIPYSIGEFMDKNRFFLNSCKASATESTCLRRRFGAIIVNPETRAVLYQGYNGAPMGREDCLCKEWCLRKELNVHPGQRYELCCSVHAEQNALLKAGFNGANGMHMYLYGEEVETGIPVTAPLPCFLCTKMILNSGITQVFTWTGNTFLEVMVDALYDKYLAESFTPQ